MPNRNFFAFFSSSNCAMVKYTDSKDIYNLFNIDTHIVLIKYLDDAISYLIDNYSYSKYQATEIIQSVSTFFSGEIIRI